MLHGDRTLARLLTAVLLHLLAYDALLAVLPANSLFIHMAGKSITLCTLNTSKLITMSRPTTKPALHSCVTLEPLSGRFTPYFIINIASNFSHRCDCLWPNSVKRPPPPWPPTGAVPTFAVCELLPAGNRESGRSLAARTGSAPCHCPPRGSRLKLIYCI